MDYMARIPDQPQDIFVPLTQDYRKVFGDELVSLILYGSAAGGSYIRGKSDINLLVVLTSAGMKKLADVLYTVHSWKKRRIAIPLIMTRDFLQCSLDSYPIEFLNMKNSHILIYGENILDSLIFKPEDLRLQIERELRGKLILLTQGYLEAEGKTSGLKKLIANSFTAFISIFNALLYLKQGKAPRERRDTIKEAGSRLAIDTAIFTACADIKEGKDHLSGAEVQSVFFQYVQEIDKLCNIVDCL
jgi:predicted nucleotidyltransferase